MGGWVGAVGWESASGMGHKHTTGMALKQAEGPLLLCVSRCKQEIVRRVGLPGGGQAAGHAYQVLGSAAGVALLLYQHADSFSGCPRTLDSEKACPRCSRPFM